MLSPWQPCRPPTCPARPRRLRGGVSVASSDGVTASPGPAQSAGTVLSEPAATAAAGAPAHTRASPASPGSSASSHDPIRDMDFDNVPALSSSCSWSDLDQELDERALNIAPEVDRPNISKGRPRIPHLRKVLTERGQAFKTSDKVETLWRLCAESHAKAAADAKAAASQYAQSGIGVDEAAAGGRSSEPAAVKKTSAKPKATYEATGER